MAFILNKAHAAYKTDSCTGLKHRVKYCYLNIYGIIYSMYLCGWKNRFLLALVEDFFILIEG